jgi:hypothetical protein
MPETLNRANTIWPRASAGPLHADPANDADDQRDPTCATQPLRSSSEIHPKRQKHRLVKKPASQQESSPSSRDESRPIADVPVPPSLRATEIVGIVSETRPHTGGLLSGNKIYNQHMVPTARALCNGAQGDRRLGLSSDTSPHAKRRRSLTGHVMTSDAGDTRRRCRSRRTQCRLTSLLGI